MSNPSRINCTTHTVQDQVKVVATDAFLPRVGLQHQSAAAPRDSPRQKPGDLLLSSAGWDAALFNTIEV